MLILKSLEPHLATWLWVATVQVPFFHLSIILHGAVLIRMVRGTLLLLFGYGKCILAFAESNRSSARGCSIASSCLILKQRLSNMLLPEKSSTLR